MEAQFLKFPTTILVIILGIVMILILSVFVATVLSVAGLKELTAYFKRVNTRGSTKLSN